MRDSEDRILNTFKNNPTKELSTEFLVMEVYPKEYASAENLMQGTDKAHIHEGKRKKFQLHRKTLYYLNKLMRDNIIKVSRIAEKGEKYFILQASEGDTIIEKGYKKIVITKPAITSTHIEQYESKGVMKKYEEDSWITRFNSVIIECLKTQEINRLYNTLSECFTNVNDVIALNDFENIINTTSEKSLNEFLDKICRDTENSNKNMSLIINIAQTNNNIIQFIDRYTKMRPKNVNIIFNINNKDVQRCSKILGHIFENFSESKIKVNFKNNDLSTAPYFKGRAGIYNFNEQEWEAYQKKSKGSTIGLICSQSQIAININKFFEIYKTDSDFRDAVLNAAKTLLLANTIQRRKSSEYFRSINNMNGQNAADFYRHGKNYIRFWNYDWHKSIQDNDNLFELIKSTKTLIDAFCNTEETIFKSCGVPIRFKIAFSSAFRNFDPRFMGERDYKKMNVSKSEDYHTGETKTFLQAREKMFEIFDGGDRLRIFRKNDFAMSDIMHEIGILLSTYKIPFFTFDFSGLRGTVKLTNFM
ncbi:MAG: hypothetical protein ACP5NW_05895 [Candidatus Woesearchaeota archaeon]